MPRPVFSVVRIVLVLASLALIAGNSYAAIDPLPFDTDAERQRFHALTGELRCVMCQNQSLADSDALIARDLRREVYELMQGGKSDAEIKTYLTDRYGEFVLYRPPLDGRTWWLWFGPGILALLALLAVLRIVRRRAGPAANAQALEPKDNEEW